MKSIKIIEAMNFIINIVGSQTFNKIVDDKDNELNFERHELLASEYINDNYRRNCMDWNKYMTCHKCYFYNFDMIGMIATRCMLQNMKEDDIKLFMKYVDIIRKNI